MYTYWNLCVVSHLRQCNGQALLSVCVQGVARLIADFLKTWEPNRATDSVKTAERPLQHQERYKWQWSIFPFFHSRSHGLKHANQLTASPLCGKFTSTYCKIFNFTMPSPELKFIWMSICAIPRRLQECYPLWVYGCPYSVMSFLWNDLDELNSFTSSPM